MTILYLQHYTGYMPVSTLLEKCKWEALTFGDLIVTSNRDGVDLFYVNSDVKDSDVIKNYIHVFHSDDPNVPMEKSGVMFAFDHSHKRKGYRKALKWMASASDTDIIEDIFNDAVAILDYKEERWDANDTMRFMRFCLELTSPEIGKTNVIANEEHSEPQVKIVEKIIEKVVKVPVERVVEKVVQIPVEKVVEKIVEVPVEKIKEIIVEKRVEVPATQTPSKNHKQLLKEWTGSLLMEYKRLGAKPKEVYRLLKAINMVEEGNNSSRESIPTIDSKILLNEIKVSICHSYRTYKPLWLCAIIKYIEEKNNYVISTDEIAIRFVAISWSKLGSTYPSTDKIPGWQKTITERITRITKYSTYGSIVRILKNNVDNQVVRETLDEIIQASVTSLLSICLNSNSSLDNSQKSKEFPNSCMYKIINRNNDSRSIEINPIWRDFLSKESKKIYQICYNRFLFVLQRALNMQSVSPETANKGVSLTNVPIMQEEKVDNKQPPIGLVTDKKEFVVLKEDKNLAKVIIDILKNFKTPVPISLITAYLPLQLDGQPVVLPRVVNLLNHMPEIKKLGTLYILEQI